MSRTDTRDGFPVVNCKDYSPLPDGGTESQREQAYEAASAEWWYDAESKAQELGFAGVYALGRSGGWIAPYYDTRRAPDLDEPREREAFEGFAAWVAAEMQPDALADRFQSYLEAIMADEPEPIPAPPADECARFLAYCENRRDRAALSKDREFWQRLAGSVRKAATM